MSFFDSEFKKRQQLKHPGTGFFARLKNKLITRRISKVPPVIEEVAQTQLLRNKGLGETPISGEARRELKEIFGIGKERDTFWVAYHNNMAGNSTFDLHEFPNGGFLLMALDLGTSNHVAVYGYDTPGTALLTGTTVVGVFPSNIWCYYRTAGADRMRIDLRPNSFEIPPGNSFKVRNDQGAPVLFTQTFLFENF